MDSQLPSWRDGTTRSAITDFVGRVTEEGGPDYVEPAARVAVFDNDGTLWTEKPLVIQLDFTIRRFRELAESEPALRTQQPYQAAYQGDMHWLGAAVVKHYHGDDSDLKLLMVAVPKAFEAVTVEDYDGRVQGVLRRSRQSRAEAAVPQHAAMRRWLSCCAIWRPTALSPTSHREVIVTSCVPLPRIMYGIPPERIIGSALGITYSSEGGQSSLLYKGAMDFFDDGPEKPVRIWSRIGRRPILAVWQLQWRRADAGVLGNPVDTLAPAGAAARRR